MEDKPRPDVDKSKRPVPTPGSPEKEYCTCGPVRESGLRPGSVGGYCSRCRKPGRSLWEEMQKAQTKKPDIKEGPVSKGGVNEPPKTKRPSPPKGQGGTFTGAQCGGCKKVRPSSEMAWRCRECRMDEERKAQIIDRIDECIVGIRESASDTVFAAMKTKDGSEYIIGPTTVVDVLEALKEDLGGGSRVALDGEQQEMELKDEERT